MPYYRYCCTSCGKEKDIFMHFSDWKNEKDKQRCECKSKMQQKIMPCALHGTDTALLKGTDDGFGNDENGRKAAYAKAKAMGISVNGKRYHPGLCRRGVPFDPLAWYSDVSEVKKKAAALGRNVEGCITHTSPIRESDIADANKDYVVADHIIQDDVQNEIDLEHGGKVSKAKKAEIFDKYRQKHSGSKKPTGKIELVK